MPNEDHIRYDLLVQEALKGVVRKVLTDAAKEGLPGEHHFFVSFRTDFPGVRVSQRLREKYPQEMTIVLQHQFWDLIITEHTFEVGLSFSGIPERLLIPFDALTQFFDPSVQFGLKFELQGEEEEGEAPPARPRAVPAPGESPKAVVPVTAKSAVPRLSGKASTEAEKPPAEEPEAPAAEDGSSKEEGGTAQVVSLDSFRKKN